MSEEKPVYTVEAPQKSEVELARDAIAKEREARQNYVAEQINALLKQSKCEINFVQVFVNGQQRAPGVWQVIATE